MLGRCHCAVLGAENEQPARAHTHYSQEFFKIPISDFGRKLLNFVLDSSRAGSEEIVESNHMRTTTSVAFAHGGEVLQTL